MTRPQLLAVVAVVIGAAILAGLLYATGRTAEAAVVGLGAGAAAVGRATANRRGRKQAAKVERREGEARTLTVRKAEAQLARDLAEVEEPADDREETLARLQRIADEAERRRSGR